MSLDRLKRIGHGLARLHAAAVAEGLTDDAEDREVLGHIDANYMRARYIETGPFTTTHPKALWGVCQVFHDEIEPLVNLAAGVTRKRVIPSLDDCEE